MHNCERNNKGYHKCAHRVIFNPQLNGPCFFLPHPKRRGGGTRGEVSVRCGPCLKCYYLFFDCLFFLCLLQWVIAQSSQLLLYLWLLISSIIRPSLLAIQHIQPNNALNMTSVHNDHHHSLPGQRPAPSFFSFLFLAESLGIQYD